VDSRLFNAALFADLAASSAALTVMLSTGAGPGQRTVLPRYSVLWCGSAFGVCMTLPIGGADMPVVISLYNAFTGLAVGP
jgi:NAD(P) transhydrogenase subunit beta